VIADLKGELDDMRLELESARRELRAEREARAEERGRSLALREAVSLLEDQSGIVL